jgi:hypothetical protein
MSTEHSTEWDDVLYICQCGYPIVPCLDENGKRIGVTHRTIEEDDHHFAFWAGLRIAVVDKGTKPKRSEQHES